MKTKIQNVVLEVKFLLDRLRNGWQRLKTNKLAVVGLFILGLFFFVAMFAPLIAPYSPLRGAAEPLQSPSTAHLMGTDDLGRDCFSGFVWGARVSLLVGTVASASAFILGVLIGSISGYYGGKIDVVLMRITEMFMVLPSFVLAIIIVAIMGSSIWNVIFVIAVLSWPQIARLTRAEFISWKEMEFVQACKIIGISDFKIIFGEILPNALPPAVVIASLQVGSAILLESGFSFLGLGDPNVASWGWMIKNAQSFLRYAWWMAFFPGLALFLVVLSTNLVGDGLNDALNPKTRGMSSRYE